MKTSFIAWSCVFAFLQTAAKPPEKLIFTNVNVVNTRDGGIEQGVTVVITKDWITGVGKVGFVAQGRNVQVINANGKYLIAGLCDRHVHTAFVTPAWDERVI
jgi:adenine deaminase